MRSSLVFSAFFVAATAMGASTSAQQVGWSIAAAEDSTPPVVLELFTSQSCSSCPPADELMQELKSDYGNLIALGMHVDYWNPLGWEDSFSDPIFTDRQRRYARFRGKTTMYTPQMVINGLEFVVGSRESQVMDALQSVMTQSQGLKTPEFVISIDDEHLSTTIKGLQEQIILDSPKDQLSAWLAIFDEEPVTIPIGAGENRGKDLTYENVVYKFVRMDLSDSDHGLTATTEISSHLNEMRAAEVNSPMGAIFVQMNGFGPIVGAESFSFVSN